MESAPRWKIHHALNERAYKGTVSLGSSDPLAADPYEVLRADRLARNGVQRAPAGPAAHSQSWVSGSSAAFAGDYLK